MTPKKKLPRNIFWDKQRNAYQVRISYRGRQIFCGRYDTLTLAKYAKEHYMRQAIDGTLLSATERRRQWQQEALEAEAARVTVADYAQRYQHQLRGRDLEPTAAIGAQWEATK